MVFPLLCKNLFRVKLFGRSKKENDPVKGDQLTDKGRDTAFSLSVETLTFTPKTHSRFCLNDF